MVKKSHNNYNQQNPMERYGTIPQKKMHSKVAESFCGERMGKHSFEMLLICHEM